MLTIIYRDNAHLTTHQTTALYKNTTLGQRRPVDKPDYFNNMFKHANLVISAWHDDRLVGIARCFTDYCCVTYLADLVVDEAYQQQGIGKQLVAEVKKHLTQECRIVLLSAPSANDFYPKIGFVNHPRSWVLLPRLERQD